MGRQVDAPREGRGAHEHADEPAREQLLHHDPVVAQHAGVMDAEAVREQLTQLLVPGPHHLATNRHTRHDDITSDHVMMASLPTT